MSYSPIPHVCKFCLGRLMQRPLEQGGFEYFCPDCEQMAHGKHPMALCMCGFNHYGKKIYKCVPNPSPTAINPFKYMAVFK